MSTTRRSIYTLYASAFLMSLQFWLPISILFGTQHLDFSFTKTMALIAVIELATVIFEVPTGAWADRYGYLFTHRLGLLLFVLPILGFVFLRNFYALILLQCLGGLGSAMISGALQAFIYNMLPARAQDSLNSSVASKSLAARHLGRAVAVIAGSFLYAKNPVLPYVLYAIALAICLSLAFLVPKRRFERTEAASNWQQTRETLQMLLATKQMRYFLPQVILYLLFSQAVWFFYQPYFASIAIQEAYFGFYYFGAACMSAIGALQVPRVIRRFGTQYVFVIAAMAVTFGTLFFLFRNPWLAFIAVLPQAGMTGIIFGTSKIVVQKYAADTHQTTALSVLSLSDGIAMVLVNLVIGVAMDTTSVMTITLTLFIIGILFCTASLIIVKRTATSFW